MDSVFQISGSSSTDAQDGDVSHFSRTILMGFCIYYTVIRLFLDVIVSNLISAFQACLSLQGCECLSFRAGRATVVIGISSSRVLSPENERIAGGSQRSDLICRGIHPRHHEEKNAQYSRPFAQSCAIMIAMDPVLRMTSLHQRRATKHTSLLLCPEFEVISYVYPCDHLPPPLWRTLFPFSECTSLSPRPNYRSAVVSTCAQPLIDSLL